MPPYQEPSHKDRISQAAAARKNVLASFHGHPARDPAAIEARRAAMLERDEARRQRAEEKARLREARDAELREAEAARQLEIAAKAEETAVLARELATKQKAARDERYRARKARAR